MHRIHTIIAIGCLCCISAGSAVHAADLETKPSGPVFSMREFELKPGVKTGEFDAFVRKEMAGAIAKDVTGLKMHILKGDRGARKGAYILVWEFDSVATRDHYFPKEGGWSSPAFQQASKLMMTVMGKFGSYIREPAVYTDYVTVSD
jgi:hypothetical protein